MIHLKKINFNQIKNFLFLKGSDKKMKESPQIGADICQTIKKKNSQK